MKILITGATGLIGKELGKLLTAHGHSVISVSRNAEKAKAELPFFSEVIEWKDPSTDFSEADEVKLSGLDAVVNLMGENLMGHRWNDEFKSKLVTSRVAATDGLVRNLTKTGLPKVWVQGSAIGYYGESKTSAPFDESSPKGEGFLADLCVKWENAISGLPPEVRPILLRTGVVFSHQGGAFPQMLDPLMKGIGGVVGSGEQRLSIVHLADMAKFIDAAIQPDSKAQGPFNLVCEETVTQKELTERLCEKLWLKQGPKIPGIAIKLMLGEMAELVLKSQAVASPRLKEISFQLSYPTVEAVINEVTAWHQHPYESNKAVYIVYSEQLLPKKREEVFSFFSNAANLEKITPEFLHFKIKRVSHPPVQDGTRILYELKLHGIAFRSLTLIAKWDPPFSFTDQQLKGPYSLWYHDHFFEEIKSGDHADGTTLMRDYIRYDLPLGIAGKLVGLAKVRADVTRIFAYRREAIARIFSN